jgi:hypothetical protein
MENIKEKVNSFFKLYIFYMLLAVMGAITYILITLSFHYSLVSVIILGVLIFVVSSFYIYEQIKNRKPIKPKRFILLKISEIFYTGKTQKNTFEPIAADWQEEYFEALHKKEIWKAHWINIRYTYAFIMAMWQKSPLGDLLEYVRKIAS